MEKRVSEIEKYLPNEWEKACREKGALQRVRGVKSASELLEVILLYLTICGSFGTTSALLNLSSDIKLSKQSVRDRVAGSWEWLKWMCEEMSAAGGMRLPKPDWLDREVIAVDGSQMSLKGSKQGDNHLHCAFDIFGFKYRTIEITGITEGEKLSRHMIKSGDIVLGDRMYGSIKGMEHVLFGGGDFILRYRTKGFNVYDADKKKIDLLDDFKHLKPTESMSVECFYYHEGKKRPVRLVAMRKDEEAIKAAHRRMNRKLCKQRGKVPSQEALLFNQYIVVATSLDYSNGRILELYRARWQIEQVFFRLKEMYAFGEVPSSNDDSVKAWFYGKLFLAILSETITFRECFSPKEQSLMRSVAFVEFVEYP